MHTYHDELVEISAIEGTTGERNPLVLSEQKFRESIIAVVERLREENANLKADIRQLENKICELQTTYREQKDQISIITDACEKDHNNVVFNKLEGLTEDIIEINKDLANFKINGRQFSNQNNLKSIVVNSNIENKPPTFKADDKDRPLKFLRDMQQYVQSNNLEINQIKYILSRSLMENAASWWDITCRRIESWEDFEKHFRDRFWSNIKIKRLQETLRYGRYRGNMTRMQYASDILSLMYELEPETDESEKIAMLINHFERSIQIAMIGKEIDSISEFNKMHVACSQESEPNKLILHMLAIRHFSMNP